MKYTINLSKKIFIIVNIGFIFALVIGICFVNFRAYNPNIVDSCAMKRMFKLYCAGCGGTRASYMLFHGKVLESILCNPLVIYIGFFVVKYYAKLWISFVKDKTRAICEIDLRVIWVLLILVIVLYIGRNIMLVAGIYDYLGDLSAYY